MAYLQPTGDGWEMYVRLPGSLPTDWPRAAFPSGAGLSAGERTAALAGLGYAAISDARDLTGWDWCQVCPDKDVPLVEHTVVRPPTAWAERV